MRKLLIALVTVVICGVCNAQVGNSQSGKVLSAKEAEYVLELFCRNYYSSCFEGKAYIPASLIIKSVGVDQKTGGTSVVGIHDYQGHYIPLRGRKTHTNVQFNAVIIRQQNGDYVIFHKYYEPDWMNRKGGWETGQGLIQYSK